MRVDVYVVPIYKYYVEPVLPMFNFRDDPVPECTYDSLIVSGYPALHHAGIGG